jgi:hypothetical protein
MALSPQHLLDTSFTLPRSEPLLEPDYRKLREIIDSVKNTKSTGLDGSSFVLRAVFHSWQPQCAVKRMLYKIKIEPCHFPLKKYMVKSVLKREVKEVNNFYPLNCSYKCVWSTEEVIAMKLVVCLDTSFLKSQFGSRKSKSTNIAVCLYDTQHGWILELWHDQ